MKGDRSLIFSSICVGFSLGASILISNIEHPLIVLLLISLGLIIGLSIYIRSYKFNKKNIDFFEPRFFVASGFFLYYFVPPLGYLIFYPKIEFLHPDSICEALLWSIIGYTCFEIGYSKSRFSELISHKLPVLENNWNNFRTKVTIIILVLFSLISFLLTFIYIGNLKDAFDILSIQRGMRYEKVFEQARYSSLIANFILPGALVLVVYSMGRDKIKIRHIIAIVLCIFMVFSVFQLTTGSRRGFIMMLLIAIICWNYLRKRISLPKVFFFAGLLLSVISILGIIRNYVHFLDVREILSHFKEPILSGDASVVILKSLDSILIYDDYLVLLGNVPARHDFLWGDTYFRLIYAFLPGSVFQKPENISVLYTKLMRPDLYHSNVTSSVSILGELYWNFSFMGIIMGIMLLGLFCRILYEYLSKHHNNKGAVLIYALSMFYVLELFRGTFHTTTLLYFTVLIVILLSLGCTRVLLRRIKPSEIIGA